MPSWRTPEFYERNDDAVITDLVSGLKQGELSLLLGAGCSKAMRLPDWPQLVRACCKEIDDSVGSVDWRDIEDSWEGQKLLMRMSVAKKALNDEKEYLKIIYKHLYSEWKHSPPKEPTPLLRAIGIMTIGSRRGRIREIVTLNFDALIEWYLTFHGYVVQIIEEVPKVLRQADVTIYHPHGYLPFENALGKPSGAVVFDQESVERRILENQGAWNDTFRNFLGSHIFIAIGLSGNDFLLRLLLKAAADRRRDDKAVGFWFYRDDADKDVVADLRSKGVAMLLIKNFSEIEDILFAVCREAAGSVIA